MNAVLSITRAEAVHITGERSARWIKREEGSSDSNAWPHVVQWVAEKDVLVFVEDLSDEDVTERLSHEVAVHDAILMLGMIFDREIPLEMRAEIAADIERLIDDRSYFASVIARLYSEPFPSGLEFDDAEKAALDAQAINTRALLKALQASQPAINTTVLAWEAVPDWVFRDSQQKLEIRAKYRDLGVFHSFSRRGSDQPIEFLFEWLPSANLGANANHRRILMEWTGPFRRQANQRRSDADWESAAKEWQGVDDDHPNSETAQGEKYYPGLIAEIESRKDGIRDLIRSADANGADVAAASLVDFQLQYGEPRFAAMSLCDVARFAEERGQISIGLALIERAIAICSTDSWSKIQHADLQRAGGRTMEAFAEYGALIDANLQPRDDLVARCGYAECLRDLGKPVEALDWYRDTLELHPNDVVARCGYAECLRDLGKPAEALDWYRDTLELHPNSVVARSGYAECLRELGKPVEALNWYRDTLELHPNDGGARNGYAKCLRELGKLAEALNWYRHTLVLHPTNTFARNAAASLLIQLNRPAEALQTLPVGEPVTAADWVALHIRGMVFLRTGDLDAARRIFERGSSAQLSTRESAYFRSALALCHLRRRDAKRAVETLADVRDAKLQTTVNVIRVHAFGADGRIADCRKLIEEIGEPVRPLARELVTECGHRFIDQAPRKNEEWLFNGELELLLAA